jgi:hypothetical protein
MNGSPTTHGVPAVRHAKRRRRRGIVPQGGQAPLSAQELKQHAQLTSGPSPMSGRSRGYVYYWFKGRQRWRRYVIPKNPRTPAQQRARAIFGTASKTWSEDGLLTEEQRDAWYADGARKESRPRLGQSGPLTGQQNYVGRNCARKQRDSGMLSHLIERKAKKPKSSETRRELISQVFTFQPVMRPTPWIRRAYTVVAPSYRRIPRGYLRKTKGRKLMSQLARFQRFTRPTRDRLQTYTGALPGQRRGKALTRRWPRTPDFGLPFPLRQSSV